MRAVNLSTKITPISTTFKTQGFYLVRSNLLGYFIKQLWYDVHTGEWLEKYDLDDRSWVWGRISPTMTVVGKINVSNRLPNDMPPIVGTPAKLPDGFIKHK